MAGLARTITETVEELRLPPHGAFIIANDRGVELFRVNAEGPSVNVDRAPLGTGGGTAGPQGEQGIQGPEGPAGPQGVPGPPGADGPAGADSIVPGPQGPAGLAGSDGAPGADGMEGPAGPPGTPGTPGADGAQGIQGPAGADGADGAAGGTFTATDMVNLVYPVGAIYQSVVSTAPGTLFGVGTWLALGAGRVLVGIDAGDADFDTAEETGGAKTHTLTAAEMPAHVHAENAPSSASGGAVKFGIDTNASGSQAAGVDTGSAGSGGAHNNLQPYIVVYRWKRTA